MRKSVPLASLALALALLASVSAAGGPRRGPAVLSQRVSRAIRAYRRDSRAVVGVSVREVPSGKVRVSIAAGRTFTPASCQKLLTSAVALERLGPDHEFTTSAYLLDEDLVVVGGFDPTLGDPEIAEAGDRSIYHRLDELAAAVRSKTGPGELRSLLLVAPPPGETYHHPDWPAGQHQRWYCAPAGPLNFHDNCLDVSFEVRDGKALARIAPQSRWIRLDNRVRVGPHHVWSLKASKQLGEVTLTGHVRRTTPDPLSVAVDNPAMLFGRVLAGRLEQAGVTLTEDIRVIDGRHVELKRARLVGRLSTPIEQVLLQANKRSLNIAAECLLLAAGDGTWAGSAEAASRTLTRRYDLDAERLRIRDGSGLSHENRITPSDLTKLLVALSRGRDFERIRASLPQAGIDGTMKRRLASQPYRGHLLAKTGSLAGVSTLAGCATDSSGRCRLAFAVLINNIASGGLTRARELQDRICKEIIDFQAAR